MKSNREWLSISDMMAGLMMVFLFIAIVFMQQINKDKESLVDIAETYAVTKSQLYQALLNEFNDDLDRWGAEILSDNTIRFKEPEVLFERNSRKIKNKFKTILNDFFPRYLSILTNEIFKNDITELRIEGHTSSTYKKGVPKVEAYIGNTWLSQERALVVLDYVFKLKSSEIHRPWLINTLRANGLSYSKIIFTDGKEDFKKSRRVEFRVITNTEEKIQRIIEESKAQ